jgi:hypothetical protein
MYHSGLKVHVNWTLMLILAVLDLIVPLLNIPTGHAALMDITGMTLAAPIFGLVFGYSVWGSPPHPC